MVAKCETKHKFKTMLEVIRALMLNFDLCLLLYGKVPFSAWCASKGHPYLNKPAPESCVKDV